MLKKGNHLTALVAIFVPALLVLTGCEFNTDVANKQRQDSIESRAQAFERAERVAPLPRTVNFPLRKALVEFTERQDMIDHPWYVYILADTGNIIGYYVAKTVPINACNFLSSTEDVYISSYGNLRLTAPSLDGIFYGGSGASSGCDAWFFFDSTTNALIQIRGVNFFSSDQPLRVEAEPITVQAVSEK